MSIFSAVAGLAGGALSAFGANRAADAQEKAAKRTARVQKEIYEQNRQDAMPWLEAGRRSLADLEASLGSTFEASEGYNFMVDEGERGVLSNLAALGLTNSGAALKELTRFREGLAQNEYNNWFNRKNALASGGQAQTQFLGNLGQNYGRSVADTNFDAGAARASGYVGGTNALNRGIEQMAAGFGQARGNALSPFNYQRMRAGYGGLY